MGQQYPYPADRLTLVGTVTRSHGLKGDFKVAPLSSFSGPLERFAQYSRAALVAADGRMTDLLAISRCRVQGKQLILKLDTIDSKNEADLIVSMGVLTPREEQPEESGDSAVNQAQQLVGLPVFTTDGQQVGELTEISRHTGAHALLIINGADGEYMVPLVDEIVVAADGKRIVIDPPDGLLDINRAEKDA